MGAPFGNQFRREMARVVAALRYEGLTFKEIEKRTGFCYDTCRAFLFYTDWKPPEWPKVVTRISKNGSWWVVRDES